MHLISVEVPSLHPLSVDPGKIMIGRLQLAEVIDTMFAGMPDDFKWDCCFFPDDELLQRCRDLTDFTIADRNGRIAGCAGCGRKLIRFSGIELRFPWHILDVSRMIMEKIDSDSIAGNLSPQAVIDGHLHLGENSRILPGVYIEGNCMIGRNCKIGPNCYLRGDTIIGDNCHIGQAVEIKNSVIGNNTAIGHLSYAGDSVIGSRVNFGAGTIIANLRHDNCNHRSMAGGVLLDTGRRKFGAVIGDGVHTGINTSIYPGRKLSPGAVTAPGATVKYDL